MPLPNYCPDCGNELNGTTVDERYNADDDTTSIVCGFCGGNLGPHLTDRPRTNYKSPVVDEDV